MTARSLPQQGSRLSTGFGVFAECLLTGVWMTLAAVPLVTAPAAFAAGVRHLRRHLRHEATGLRHFAGDFRAAVRGGWLVGLSGPVALWLLWLNLAAVRAGLPGGPFVGAVAVLAAIGAVVAVLRAAAVWDPGASWPALLRAAARRTLRDPAGSLLLVGGFAVVAGTAWAVAPLAVPVTGAVAAAAVAVEARHAAG
ncbi:hypothetical protein ACH46N_11495 [Streptomyces pristinaespiralis]|jgi:hypothetical protein|uniref:Membrane protein n=2 Tax=Streptomyces pristinaespiralis TaxID=38300 RepID=A0A0M3QKJ6_STRPR|nr:hypothetical protein [Streptomyces pristinaespiralis]ALC24883.1 membrane protein [Streptomyces pristinaespiralis]QMU12824.1 hypothetical protein H3L99_03870 [Streptomyces pristinaespiralis]